MRAVLPVMLTMYDVKLHGQFGCAEECMSNGGHPGECNAECAWRCGDDPPTNITEPVFGLCDPSQGCLRVCGTPDWPIARYSTASSEIGMQTTFDNPFDFDDNGKLDQEEVRAALLRYFGNCTYYVRDSLSSKNEYCKVEGRSQFNPADTTLRKVCGIPAGSDWRNGQPPNWRIDNEWLPSESDVAPDLDERYPHLAQPHLPRECRPFPDYDPALSGRVYDPRATREQCPECFLTDGSRVPPHYYNRSTWSNENYRAVMLVLRQVFTDADLDGAYFPYFNISDDRQFSLFSDKLLAPDKPVETVAYARFNYNLQTTFHLDFMLGKAKLLNPWCFNGRLLKLRPHYDPDATTEEHRAAMRAAAIHLRPDGSHIVENTRMPHYPKSNAPGATNLLPCPDDWGNGEQGSTTFSYFRWAEPGPSGRGFKWGKALPEFCFDEAWPTGGKWNGTHGLYPDDRDAYGMLAGLPIQPGCIPTTCKPTYKARVRQGSVHAQVSSRLPDDRQLDMFDNIRLLLSLVWQGVPDHQKWFWTSRSVYMAVEPAYFHVMSGGKVCFLAGRSLPSLLTFMLCVEVRWHFVSDSCMPASCTEVWCVSLLKRKGSLLAGFADAFLLVPLRTIPFGKGVEDAMSACTCERVPVAACACLSFLISFEPGLPG
ncbi:hypothetical protein DUNSADRAFT_5008, partial [Dunaliella salina]